MQQRLSPSQHKWLIYAGLAGFTLALYLPALGHDFIGFDDQQYVTENARVQAGLTWHGLVWAFGFHAGNWHPFAWLSHMLDCQLFGTAAAEHHLTSILLHTATTLLLLAIFHRLTGHLWRSAAVAAIFAWHPLHVESIAWVAERKDVLCAFFWMLTLWFYLRYREQVSVSRYLLTLAAFIFCLLSKPMAVTLPFVLVLLDVWPLKQWSPSEPTPKRRWRLVADKIPFGLLALAGCWLTLRAQQLAIVSTGGLPVTERIIHTTVAYQHYFTSAFLPTGLGVYYPYIRQLPATTVVFSILLLLGVSFVGVIQFRQRPYILVGWLWFLGTLVPVIGLVQVGDQAWADRYTYLPMIGLSVAVVWTAAELVKNRLALQIAALIAAITMLALTTLQLRYWQNTQTLFAHTKDVTRDNYLAVTILGSLLAKDGKYEAAKACYEQALRWKPNFPEAHFYLGTALDEQGRLDEAIAEYQQALWFRPTQEQTHIFLGIALAKQKKYAAAIEHYLAALKLNPDSAITHNNLARIYHTLGQRDAAIIHYQAALDLDPKLALAHNNLGVLLLQQGDVTDGIVHLRQALKSNPTNSETMLNLGFALNQQQRWLEATNWFTKAVRNETTDPRAHYEFAAALAHTGRTREAMAQYAAALLLRQDYPEALDGLAWILSTAPDAENRNGTEAVIMAERACELTQRKDPVKLITLAAADAEAGQSAEAMKALHTAELLVASGSNPALASQCAAMRLRLEQNQPWRE